MGVGAGEDFIGWYQIILYSAEWYCKAGGAQAGEVHGHDPGELDEAPHGVPHLQHFLPSCANPHAQATGDRTRHPKRRPRSRG